MVATTRPCPRSARRWRLSLGSEIVCVRRPRASAPAYVAVPSFVRCAIVVNVLRRAVHRLSEPPIGTAKRCTPLMAPSAPRRRWSTRSMRIQRATRRCAPPALALARGAHSTADAAACASFAAECIQLLADAASCLRHARGDEADSGAGHAENRLFHASPRASRPPPVGARRHSRRAMPGTPRGQCPVSGTRLTGGNGCARL